MWLTWLFLPLLAGAAEQAPVAAERLQGVSRQNLPPHWQNLALYRQLPCCLLSLQRCRLQDHRRSECGSPGCSP